MSAASSADAPERAGRYPQPPARAGSQKWL